MRPHQKNISFRLWVFSSILFLGCIGAGFFIWKENASHSRYTVNVGLLSGEKIWTELPAIKQLKGELNHSLNEQQKRFSHLEEGLRKENQQLLQEHQKMLSGTKKDRAVLEQKQQTFSVRVMQLQKDAEDAQKKINQIYEQSMGVIKEKIIKSIKKVARQKNLSLVLYDTQVAYHVPALDITEDVFNDLKDFKYPPLKW